MVDVKYIDLENVESVSEIKPEPTLAIKENAHHIGSLGSEGKRLMLELLSATDESEPADERVFGRLGLPYQHTTWQGYDLLWAEVDNEEVVAALERWNSGHSM